MTATARDRSGNVSVWLEGTGTLDLVISEVGPDCGLGACVASGAAGATFAAVSPQS